MPIQVNWDGDSHTTLLLHFDPEWSWDDFHSMVLRMADLARQVEHPVDLIFDLSVSRSVGSEAVVHIRRWIALWPPNTGHIAAISRQLMVTAVISILTRTTPACRGNVSMADSLDEARRILAERRGT